MGASFDNFATASPSSNNFPQCRGSREASTANIPSPHSLAAILSPPAPSEATPKVESRPSSPKRTHAEAFSADQQPYLHPASPTQQHRISIASSVKSPGSRADEGSGGGMNGGREEKKQPPKMVRSSVACARCRRSKVKCVNDGSGGMCRACENSNRECTYPPSGSTATPRRDPGTRLEDGESKKRIKKVEENGRRGSARTEAPLESPVLTKKVWDEVYETFKSHFSTEMSFLHPPSFRARCRQVAYPRDPSTSASDLQESKLILLGVLTLTARFQPELIAHHAQPGKPVDPLDASEYYATALKAAFGPLGSNLTIPKLDGIQALLMLGLYEWGQTRGLTAWVYIGIAIRLAQSMALAFEDDPDARPLNPSPQKKGLQLAPPPREDAIEKESRRRTLWSCFVMDRMLSAGKYRPNMFNAETLRVRLPCSDESFMFVRSVQTGFLKSSDVRQATLTITDDGVLSRYIQLVEIFGRFSIWSYAGGRRTESFPPWDKTTQYYQLSKELENFYESLPSDLTFTEANLSAHIESNKATTEYVPFLPFRCEDGPEGPLDAPTFPKKKFPPPKNFWQESAGKMCRAARNIVDIVRTCQDNNALPESAVVQFSIYQAAFVCVYIVHFEKMDPYGSLHQVHDGHMNGEPRYQNYDALTIKIMNDMVGRSKMVKSYLKTLHKMHTFFRNEWIEYRTRFGGKQLTGGGLEQYKLLEKELKEFGSLEDNDKTHTSDGSDMAEPGRSRASTNDLGGPASTDQAANDDPMQGVEALSTSRSFTATGHQWAAVNASSPQMDTDDRMKYHPGHSQAYSGPYQSPNQNSQPPELVRRPSNDDSTPGTIHSPYTQGQQYNMHNSGYGQMAYDSRQILQPLQTFSTESKETWVAEREALGFSNSNFDNFAQIDQHSTGFPMGLEQQHNFFVMVNGFQPTEMKHSY